MESPHPTQTIFNHDDEEEEEKEEEGKERREEKKEKNEPPLNLDSRFATMGRDSGKVGRWRMGWEVGWWRGGWSELKEFRQRRSIILAKSIK